MRYGILHEEVKRFGWKGVGLSPWVDPVGLLSRLDGLHFGV